MGACLLNGFLTLFLPSPLFLDTSGIWWQDQPSLAAVEASWDVAEMAALRKAADDGSDLSHLEGDSPEKLALLDPVSVWLSVESIFSVSLYGKLSTPLFKRFKKLRIRIILSP